MSEPKTMVNDANVNVCFCFQQVSEPKQPAKFETTNQHWGSIPHHDAKVEHHIRIQHTTREQNQPGRIETTSHFRNNQPTLRQHTTPWCESGTLLSHSTHKKTAELKQPARIQTTSQYWGNTIPECKVKHWLSAFCLSLVRPKCFCIQYTAKQVPIPKKLRHHDAEVEYYFLIHHTTKQITEPKQQSRIGIPS